MRRTVIWLALYAVAMACVESAVVVYLRAIYYPSGFSFPITIIPDAMAWIEVTREAATVLMLAAVAALAGRDRWERFLSFCVAFGIWDIAYYLWLRVFIGWPESLLTWDILFLIPVPWIGPVLAPVLVSVGLIAGPLWLMGLRERHGGLRFAASHWGLATAGGLLVLLSFMLDYQVALKGLPPPAFRWGLFAAGLALGVAALVMGGRAQERLTRPDARRERAPGSPLGAGPV